MNPDSNDPRITAYALGELTGEDAAAFEKVLAEHPEIAAEVEAIRAMSGELQTALAAEPVTPLSGNARSAINGSSTERKIIPFRRVLPYLGGSIAAALVITMFLPEITSTKERSMAKSGDQTRLEEPVIIRNSEEREGQITIVTNAPTRRSVTVDERLLAADAKNLTEEKLEEMREATVVKVYQRTPDALDTGATSAPASGVATDYLATASTPIQAPRESESKDADAYAIATSSPSSKPATVDLVTGVEERLKQEAIVLYEAEPTSPAPLDVQPTPTRTRIATASTPPPESSFRSFSVVERGRQPVDQTIELAKETEARRSRFDEAYGGARTMTRETASYPAYKENSFLTAIDHPLSTFSTDVDTASYANIRRFLNEGRLPPEDAVRIEEMINYFDYDYPQPEGDVPFSINLESASAPWNPQHRLVRIGLKGREIEAEERPSCNLVFLVDISGSMKPENRLPTIKQGLRFLARELQGIDRVAIVTYANNSGLALPSTSVERKDMILAAIDRLQAGGSTNGGDGIRQAYKIASEHFIKDGVNRVILCTDGDFNVGTTNQDELIELIKDRAKTGIFLSALGVGTDNYKDSLLQGVADNGNGNYHYIDSVEEAHKVLIQQMSANLITIAKDVKIQVEFNPSTVNAYRLVGYEKRVLAAQDFNDDKKDAGEIGAGHTVTALYEVVPAGVELTPPVDGLKYQKPAERPARLVELTDSREMLTLKLRYKAPDGDVSRLEEQSFKDSGGSINEAPEDIRFAAAVAEFGMILRGSKFRQNANFDSVLRLARNSQSHDPGAYRADFINLVQKARQLKERTYTIQETPADPTFK